MLNAALPASDPDYMQSLARGLEVLRVFEAHPGVTPALAARETGLPRAVVRRCLHTLSRLGYVRVTEGGDFRLTPVLLPLARAYGQHNPLIGAAEQILRDLRDAAGESCSVGVLDGQDVAYVARAEVHRFVSIALEVGSRLPLYCTSMGRVLLAGMTAEAREAYLAGAPFPARTPKTLTELAPLRAAIERVDRQGYAIIDEELERGLRSASAPVRDRTGRVVAALNVGAPATRTVEELELVVLPLLLQAARALGAAL